MNYTETTVMMSEQIEALKDAANMCYDARKNLDGNAVAVAINDINRKLELVLAAMMNGFEADAASVKARTRDAIAKALEAAEYPGPAMVVRRMLPEEL